MAFRWSFRQLSSRTPKPFLCGLIVLVILNGAMAMIETNLETTKLVNLGTKFLEECADKAVKANGASGPIIACLKEKETNDKEANFPAEIWETFMKFIMGQADAKKQLETWNLFKTKDAAAAEKREKFIKGAFDSTPPFAVHPDNFKRKRLEDKPPTIADQVTAALKGTTFDKLFDKRFTLAVPGKTWEGSDGVAYLVKQQGADECVLKAVRSHGSDLPAEFTIHEKLAKLFPKFIPAFIDKGFSTDDAHKFAFVVMQRFGISVDRWLGFPKENLLPSKAEAILFLRRSFDILNEIHAGGFAHNDCHAKNWALSRTNTKDLYLIDFGRSVEMKLKNDFGYIAIDFWWWTTEVLQDMIDEIATDRKETKFAATAKKVIASLKTELKKVLYFHPDDPRLFMHYAKMSRTTHPEQIKVEGIKEFLTQAEAWLKTAEATLKPNTGEITRWTASAGDKRRKRSPAENPAKHAQKLA